MKICVLSDSHYKKGDSSFVIDYLRNNNFDAIVHAGDIGDIAFYNAILDLASTYCVAGNCDNEYNHQYFGTRQTINFGKIKLGLIHGNQGKGESMVEKLHNIFKYDKVNVVVFGHTHKPFNQTVDGVLYFNPGSCSADAKEPSVGILTVDGENINGEIVYLEK
jgi:putative phosphoesterase